MYRVITIAVVLLFVSSVADATTNVSTDGAWWSALNEEQKIIAVQAATSAYEKGDADGRQQQLGYDGEFYLNELKHFNVSTAKALAYEVAHDAGNDVPPTDFSGKTFRAYIDGIDYFYSGHPDSISVNFASVLQCLLSDPWKSCDKVAKDGY